MEIADYQSAMENQTYSALMERHNVYMMRPEFFDDEIKAVRQAMIFQSKKALKETKCKGRNKIAMDCLRCQDDQVKSSTSDKRPHCRKTRADTSECTTTSEKGPSKLLACMATPKKRLKDT
jgi:hypothetical protein